MFDEDDDRDWTFRFETQLLNRFVKDYAQREEETLKGTPCVYCGAASEGNYGFDGGDELSGAMDGIYFALCDRHGSGAEPDFGQISARIEKRLMMMRDNPCAYCGAVSTDLIHHSTVQIDIPPGTKHAGQWRLEDFTLCIQCYEAKINDLAVSVGLIDRVVEESIPIGNLFKLETGRFPEQLVRPFYRTSTRVIVDVQEFKLSPETIRALTQRMARARELLSGSDLED